MKLLRHTLALLSFGLLFSSCKAPEPEPFGIPDDPDTGFMDRLKMREESWAEKRHRWKVNERKKSQEMFNRMQDEY